VNFLLLILIPVVVSIVAFFLLKATITTKEFLLQISVGVIVVVASWFIAKYAAVSDTEHLNGRITQKVHGTQKCCHCHDECDAKDKDGKCTRSHEECSHTTDYYWNLKTSVGTIDVEDCSGWDSTPDVWAQARVGEPAAVSHIYQNFLLADPESLFVHKDMGKFLGSIPKYPKIYNLYKVNHVIGLDVPVPAGWQDFFRELNADFGATKQVDVTVVLTTINDPTYAQALEAKWLYGPKNSITLVVGVEGQAIKWVRVVTISRVEDLKIHLRDNLQTLDLSDPKVLDIIRQGIAQEFHRTPMSEFAYLMDAAQPTGGTLALLVIIQLLVSIGLTILMHKKDVFGEERQRRMWS
jgi:hypothetical protein